MQQWIQILLRSLSLFTLVWASVRILGKKGNIRHMRPFAFIGYMIIAIVAAFMSLNLIDLFSGIMVLGTWIILPVLLDYLSIKSKAFHELLNGKETVLIKHGKILEENLLQLRMTGEDLMAELRSKNIFNLSDIEFAVMETDGEVNAYLKSGKKPATPHDLGKKVAPQAEPQTVVMDGNILDEPLASLGFNRPWLETQLQNMGVTLENVFLGQVNSSGELYLDLFDDAVQVPQPQDKEILYAILEKSQADLSKYALETENKKAKTMYSKNADKLDQVMNALRPYLLH